MERRPRKLNRYPPNSNQTQVNKYLDQVIPPFVSKNSVFSKVKGSFKVLLWLILPITILPFLAIGIFFGYRVSQDPQSFWHYLRHNKTIAVTLTDEKRVQDTAVDGILDQLTQPGKPIQQKLIELAVSGYAQSDFYRQKLVVYDDKLSSMYKLTFEQRIQTAIDFAYSIYNHFDSNMEREVYGITTDELIYQNRLKVRGYPPVALKNTIFEGRRYFPFALIAGQVAGIDPLRLLKIFEIESDFNETVVGRNNEERSNDDIGIAQNNLAVLPGLIRDILNPNSPVYSPFFEYLSPGEDLETGEPLTWRNYLIRLEEELKATHNRQTNPTGQYYINRLKEPHIGAFLAAYHIKRDETYSLYEKCFDFYRDNASELKSELKLEANLDPFDWTEYSFYNGGPKRWFVIQTFLEMRKDNEAIPEPLQEAVQITKRRNMVAQKIGAKNEYLRNLAYDPVEKKVVKNDGLFRYGLYGFSRDYQRRDLLYNLKIEFAQQQGIKPEIQTQ